MDRLGIVNLKDTKDTKDTNNTNNTKDTRDTNTLAENDRRGLRQSGDAACMMYERPCGLMIDADDRFRKCHQSTSEVAVVG